MTVKENKRKFTIFLEEILKKSYVYPYLGINAFDKKVDVVINYGSADCFIAASPVSEGECSYRIQVGVLNALNRALVSDGGLEDYRWLKNVFLGCFYHEGAHLLWTYFGDLSSTFHEAKRNFVSKGFNILEDLFVEALAIDRVEKFKLAHEKNFLEEAFREMRAFYFGEMKYKSSFMGGDPMEINNATDFLNWVLCFIRGARPPKNTVSEKYLPLLKETLSAFWKEGDNKKRCEIAVYFFALIWDRLGFRRDDFCAEAPSSFMCDIKGTNRSAPVRKTPVPLSATVPGSEEESHGDAKSGSDESEEGSEEESHGDAKSGSDESEEGSEEESHGDAKSGSDESEEDSEEESHGDAKSGSDESEEDPEEESHGGEESSSDESEEGLLLKEISTVEGLCSSLDSFVNFDLLLYGSETVHLLEELDPLSQKAFDFFEGYAREAKENVSLYIEEIKDKFQELIMEKKSRMVGGNPLGKLNLDSYMKNPGIANSLKWFDMKRGSDYKQDLVMTLLVDFSGSMCGYRTKMANQSVILLDEVCTFLGIPLQIEYFSVLEPEESSTRKSFSHASTLITREFDDRRIAKLYPIVNHSVHFSLGERRFLASGNSDPFNVAGALNRLRERKEEKKILVVLSDGDPRYDDVINRSSGYCDKLNNLFKEIVREEKEILVYGIGIETYAVKDYYPNYFMVANAADLVGYVDELIKKILFV